jgi:hypothetical protein
LKIHPNEWIIFKVAYKEKHAGTTLVEFPNDGIPRYVESDTFLDIRSLSDAKFISNNEAEDAFSENEIEIRLNPFAFKKINNFSKRSPKDSIGVFVMNKPFALIHMVYSLEEPIMRWSGEDDAGTTLIIELIKTYKTIDKT